MPKKYPIYYLLLFYAVICALSMVFFDGTGDSGDSISHYLYARYAPAHPVLYFDHWAKPLFVLLASPFAQLGFNGMKAFNVLVGLAVLFFTSRTAEQLKFRHTLLAPLFLMFSPLNYILTFSGLTEPLFALFTILGVYLCSRQQFLSAALIISFLPYVRSEGLILIGVFGLYFLYKKLWKPLPLLLAGSVAYGIAGYFIYANFLWVFTHIPYAKLSSVYGRGELLHFVEELISVTGVPIYALFWTGFLALLFNTVRKKSVPETSVLLLLGFSCFFVAHSLFWYLGIFNSMGLKRVLIGIMPIIALIALQGFNLLTHDLLNTQPGVQKAVKAAALLYVLFFPFVPNPAAIQWEKDMMLTSDQRLGNELAAYLKKGGMSYPLLYHHRYLSLPLKLDYFDSRFRKDLSPGNVEAMKPGDLLVWDNLYGNFESGMEKPQLDARSDLELLRTFETNDRGKEIVFALYKKRRLNPAK